ALLIGALVVVAHLLDPLAWRVVQDPSAAGHDWHRLLRVCGFWPTWIPMAVAIGLQEQRPGRAGFLLAASGVSGLMANVLKIMLQRGRPGPSGEYVFNHFDGAWWDTGALGLPSGHTAVAFGAAWALVRLYPRGGWVAVALAAGCGFTRVLDRAHFLSDATLAAGVAWAVVAVMWSRWPR
ncbi:MAG: phosphatase PAP2 family protein, partial [Myxococcota bacterium]